MNIILPRVNVAQTLQKTTLSMTPCWITIFIRLMLKNKKLLTLCRIHIIIHLKDKRNVSNENYRRSQRRCGTQLRKKNNNKTFNGLKKSPKKMKGPQVGPVGCMDLIMLDWAKQVLKSGLTRIIRRNYRKRLLRKNCKIY